MGPKKKWKDMTDEDIEAMADAMLAELDRSMDSSAD
jgi:hypothetical protein